VCITVAIAIMQALQVGRGILGRVLVTSAMSATTRSQVPAGLRTFVSQPSELYIPTPAIDLINQLPPRKVHEKNISCDGGTSATWSIYRDLS